MTKAVTLFHTPLLMLNGNLLWPQLRLILLKKKMTQTKKTLKLSKRSKNRNRKNRKT